MSGGKSALQQAQQINLATGHGQCIEVHVVNVDVAVFVGSGILGVDHVHLVEFFRAFGTVFQHGSHGGVSVDVGVFPLDVVVSGLLEGQILVDVHQPGVHVTDAGALRAIEDVFLGGSGVAVFNENLLHCILNLLHRRDTVMADLQQIELHLLRQVRGHFPVLSAQNLSGVENCVGDFVNIKRDDPAVALYDTFDSFHCSNSFSCCLCYTLCNTIYCRIMFCCSTNYTTRRSSGQQGIVVNLPFSALHKTEGKSIIVNPEGMLSGRKGDEQR